MKYYNKPTMVKYLETLDKEGTMFESRYGIAIGQTVICALDGGVVDKKAIHQIESELSWIDISDAIAGDM